MPVKGIMVDFGDTIAYVDPKKYERYIKGLCSILRRHGYKGKLDDLTLLLDGLYHRSSQGEMKSFREFWNSLLKDLRMPKTPRVLSDLDDYRKHNYTGLFKLYEGVISVLSRLREKYKLALVSNCAAGLSGIIRELGIADFFDSIVLSYQIGVRKPDKRIYLAALRGLKLEPFECIFVADEISDLEGAREIGLKTLLVRQGEYITHEAKNPDFEPDLQCDFIANITQLL